MIPFSRLSPAVRWRSTFSMVTVASSTRMPTARARPPSVIRLMVCPKALRRARDVSTESGIEMAMISVLRHEPRKSRIINAVNVAAMTPSLTTPLTAAVTKSDWSPNCFICTSSVSVFLTLAMAALTPAATLSVDALPFLRMVSKVLRTPSWRTRFCCGIYPSRTWATSRTRITVPSTVLIGKSFSRPITPGLVLRSMGYSLAPIFAVPLGYTRFCIVSAFTTSDCERFCASNALTLRSTEITRCLPPKG